MPLCSASSGVAETARIWPSPLRARGHPHLMIDGHRTVLPPVIDRIIHQAANTGRPRSTIGRSIVGTPWLFPANEPGNPSPAAH